MLFDTVTTQPIYRNNLGYVRVVDVHNLPDSTGVSNRKGEEENIEGNRE